MRLVLFVLFMGIIAHFIEAPAQSISRTSTGTRIDFLFEQDGCKVYRFYDGGFDNKVFSTCPAPIPLRHHSPKLLQLPLICSR
ncbi:DUF4884 domain-containing protein [Rhizobium sp. Z1P35]